VVELHILREVQLDENLASLHGPHSRLLVVGRGCGRANKYDAVDPSLTTYISNTVLID
jgi:hypothetical protein